jgi:hypothetical protein
MQFIPQIWVMDTMVPKQAGFYGEPQSSENVNNNSLEIIEESLMYYFFMQMMEY